MYAQLKREYTEYRIYTALHLTTIYYYQLGSQYRLAFQSQQVYVVQDVCNFPADALSSTQHAFKSL